MVESHWPAPAKLNLFLHITGKRPDGFHDLQTLFQLIDLCDDIAITVRDDGVIERTAGPAGVPAETDLVVRAAHALKAATGTPLGASLRVTKRIPMGGGLGGGSSDAATVLLALNHLWKTGLTREQLSALALGLGADVPVFVFGRSAFAEGVGERLTAVELPAAWYVVLTPRVAVSTARVFAHSDLKRDSEPIRIQRFSAGPGGNDLQPVVCGEFPEVARHLAWLGRQAPAMMTGSGASVFAAFGSEHEARAVLARLPPDMTGFAACGLDRHPLQHLAG